MRKGLIYIIPSLLTILVCFLIFQIGSKTFQIEANEKSDFKHKVSYDQLTSKTQKEVMCLAENIFFESAHEPLSGQVAVAMVTLNRVNNDGFPNTICGVVKQIKHRGICQFSWYCEGKQSMEYLTRHNKVLYNDIINLAVDVYANHDKMNDPSRGALFYHANYVRPVWRKNLDKVAVIGNHIFYNERGIYE